MATIVMSAPSQGRLSKSLLRLPLAWLLILPLVFFAVSGRFSFEDDTSDVLSANYSSPIGTFGGILAYVPLAILILLNSREVLKTARQMKWMTVLALLPIVSTLWSQNPSRSFLYGLCYLLSTLFAYFLVGRFDGERIMDLVEFTGVAVALLCIVSVVALPQFGVTNDDPRNPGAWVGIFSGRTAAAKVLTFLLTPGLIARASGRRWPRYLYALSIVFLILMTRPVTGLVMMCLYAAFVGFLFTLRRLARPTALTLSFAFIPCVLLLVFLAFQQLPLILRLLGRDLTLTGRTEIWQGLLESVSKRPFLGYGYSAFWQGLNGESAKAILRSHWIFSYAHNGLLEIALQVGVVGLVIFLITLLMAFKDGWTCMTYGQSPAVEWCLGLLVLTCMYNIDEETLFFPKDLLSILYIVACTSLARKAAGLRRSIRELQLENTYQ